MKQTLSDEQRHLIETAIQQADELFFALELDSQHRPWIIFANNYTLKILGCSASEIRSVPFDTFCGRATNPILVEQLRHLDELHDFCDEGLCYPRHGEPFYAAWKLIRIDRPAGEPIQWFAIIRDISAQRHMQELRWQRQKIESLGVLAAGIAHDFNNLLAVILGNASMAATELPHSSPIQEMIRPIEVAAHRAAELTRQMLTYAGKDRLVEESIDINQMLQELCIELGVSLSLPTRLEIQFDQALPHLMGDSTQIRRALRNVILNAYEAIGPLLLQGTIQLTTDILSVDSAYAATTYLAPDIVPGNHIRIVICDNGLGIQADLLERIFEPFFTTKFIGRGLGLPETLGIISAHRGTIKIESAPNQGTTCTLTLPLAQR